MYLQSFFVILVLACCSSVMSSPMLRISAMYFLCSHSIVFLMAFLVALKFAQSSGLPNVLALLYCLCLARIDLLILLFIQGMFHLLVQFFLWNILCHEKYKYVLKRLPAVVYSFLSIFNNIFSLIFGIFPLECMKICLGFFFAVFPFVLCSL